jgi:endonuclease YncB( thermonuclease family)
MAEWLRIGVVGIQMLASAVDGDTIRLGSGELVRLKGFNTPELHSRCPTPEARSREVAKARQARARLAELLSGKHVFLTLTSEYCGHGRHCGLLSSGYKDAGQTLIREGLAEPMECVKGKCPPPRNWCSG